MPKHRFSEYSNAIYNIKMQDENKKKDLKSKYSKSTRNDIF